MMISDHVRAVLGGEMGRVVRSVKSTTTSFRPRSRRGSNCEIDPDSILCEWELSPGNGNEVEVPMENKAASRIQLPKCFAITNLMLRPIPSVGKIMQTSSRFEGPVLLGSAEQLYIIRFSA